MLVLLRHRTVARLQCMTDVPGCNHGYSFCIFLFRIQRIRIPGLARLCVTAVLVLRASCHS
jgi:hypothetical protein